MPILNWLEFTEKKLAVSYRASAEPQQVDIDLVLNHVAGVPRAWTSISSIVGYINGGMGGSDVFAPSAGQAELLTPFQEKGVRGPKYHYKLRMASAAPIFIRTIVEELRGAGWQEPIKSLKIIGSLPTDASDLSVTETRVRDWLEDPTAYARRWSKLGFAARQEDKGAAGVTFRMVFGKPLTVALKGKLRDRVLSWHNMSDLYVNPAGKFERIKLGQALPRYAFTKREMTVRIERFDRTHEPASALLVNMLQRVHDELIPIGNVELMM
jgi:hypothetical protein